MDEELTPEQKFAAEDAETMVPRAIIQGRSKEEIIAELTKLDWSRAAAESLVDRVLDDLKRFEESPASRKSLVQEARWQFIGGIVAMLLGIGVTLATFLAALAGLGFFILAFGLFLADSLQLAGGGLDGDFIEDNHCRLKT
jgi:uncharacterized membrane protein